MHSLSPTCVLWPYGVHDILPRLNTAHSYVAIFELQYVAIFELQVQVYRHVGRSSLFLSGQGAVPLVHLHMAPYPLCNCG